MINLYVCAGLLSLAALVGCGGSRAPEGFSEAEWRQERSIHPSLVQAHLWIDKDRARRKQRDMAVVACFQAFALSHVDPEGILEDLPRRKLYYHRINTTWLPELALKAQRGEGWFGFMVAQELENEAQRCWNPKAAMVLREAAGKIRAL